MKKLVALLLIFSFLTLPAQELVNFKNDIKSCNLYFATTKLPTSHAFYLSNKNPEEFESSVKKIIAEKGISYLEEGTFYMTGVPMGKSGKNWVNDYNKILEQNGVNLKKAMIRPITIPRSMIEKIHTNIIVKMMDRIKYFFPSISKDFENIQLGEAALGLTFMVFNELGTSSYVLSSAANLRDATLTLVTHFTTLTFLTVFGSSVGRWIMRSPGSLNIGKISLPTESLAKQFLLSLPFILNFQIFLNYSSVDTYMHSVTSEQFFNEFFASTLPNFFKSQTPSLILQTVFYNMVMTKNMRGWIFNQPSIKESEAAKNLFPLVTIPLALFDGWSFAQAGSLPSTYHLGPFDLNQGHLYLTYAIAGGWLYSSNFAQKNFHNKLIKYYLEMTTLMNPKYENLKTKMKTFREMLKKKMGIDIEETI